MRRNLPCIIMLLITFCMGTAVLAQSKQNFQLKPVVLGDSLLCPNGSTTLHTQKFYDTYQWYKRDYFSNKKELIAGATTNELVVTNDDILKYFSVEITLGGIKRTSNEKLVDGLVFIPPTVKSSGDFKNGPGYFILDKGDTGRFTLLQPYNKNITWYKNNEPIPGETTPKLQVTKGGTYTVKGAPAACPDYIQYLGVDLIVKIEKKVEKPVITGDTLLCPDSKGVLLVQEGYDSYQWYKRFYGSDKKTRIKGATANTLNINTADDAPAYFSVRVTSKGDTLKSAEKLVDSYVFLLPSVISGGDFIDGPGYFLLNKGDTGTFTLTQPYDTNITWYKNDQPIAGENSVTLNVTKPGDYTVQGAPAVCPNFIQNPGVVLTVKLTSAIAANEPNDNIGTGLTGKQLRLYPNPAKNFVMLDVAAFAGKDIEVSLSGVDGKILFVKNYTRVSSTIKLELANVKAGTYYIKAGDKAKQQLLKLIVTK